VLQNKIAETAIYFSVSLPNNVERSEVESKQKLKSKKESKKKTYFLKKGMSCMKPPSIGSKSFQGVTAQKGLELLVCAGFNIG
jgi:hypothetical protein